MAPSESPSTSTDHVQPEADLLERLPALEFVIGELVSLAEEELATQDYLRSALDIIGRGLRIVHAEIEVRHGAALIREEYTAEGSDPEFWRASMQTLLTDTLSAGRPLARLYRGKGGQLRIALFSTPVRASDSTSGALAAIAPCHDHDQAEELVDRLSALSSLTFQLLMTRRAPGRPAATGADNKSVGSIQKVAEFTSETQLAFAITNKLRMRDGCDLVALASVTGTQVKVLSISGLDEISAKSPGVRAIKHAMEECADIGQPLVNQVAGRVDESRILTGSPLHRAWHESCGNAPVASIPFFVAEECVAVLSVRRSSGSSFTSEDIDEFHELVEPYTGGLEMVRRANRSFFSHLRLSTRRWFAELFGRGTWGRKGLVLAGLTFFGWFLFGSMNYRLTVPCSLTPSTRRTLAAPFDGMLLSAPHMPGDLVREGDILCRFDTRELQLEEARLASELKIFELDVSRALADDSPVDHKLGRASLRQTQANLDLLRFKIESSTLRAPYTGTILKGDLRERIGDAIPKGSVLFEVAAHSDWRLELMIPERDVAPVAAGLAGVFASRSRPDLSHEFCLTRVQPSAEKVGGKNVFVAEAEAEIEEEWMRSGMEGLAKIEVGPRAPWWIALHGLTDSLRMHLWL